MIELDRVMIEKFLPRGARELARVMGVSIPTVWREIARRRREGVPIVARKTRQGWRYELGARTAVRIPRGLPWIPKRRPEANKFDFGRVAIVAGSYGMAGAAILAGRAALRAGAGLVTMVSDPKIYSILAPSVVEAVYRPLRDLGDVLQKCDACAVGPGMGPGANVVYDWPAKPTVIDADAINALSRRPSKLRPGPYVLTPHEGELSRLIGIPSSEIRKHREAVAVKTARRFGVVIVLKGHRTIVTDGSRTTLNPTGNPGLATPGSGDVLTGVIAALLGQGFEPYDAARLGAWLHGRAGDLAGGAPLIASDLIDALPLAVRERQR